MNKTSKSSRPMKQRLLKVNPHMKSKRSMEVFLYIKLIRTELKSRYLWIGRTARFKKYIKGWVFPKALVNKFTFIILQND